MNSAGDHALQRRARQIAGRVPLTPLMLCCRGRDGPPRCRPPSAAGYCGEIGMSGQSIAMKGDREALARFVGVKAPRRRAGLLGMGREIDCFGRARSRHRRSPWLVPGDLDGQLDHALVLMRARASALAGGAAGHDAVRTFFRDLPGDLKSCIFRPHGPCWRTVTSAVMEISKMGDL